MLKRRTRPKMGVREEPQIRCPSHLKWVRGHECACSIPVAYGTVGWCSSKIEAAHVRTGTDGGMALKPGDNWVIPLCSYHHAIQHKQGEPGFEKTFKISMKSIAMELWLKSPHGIKWRKEHE